MLCDVGSALASALSLHFAGLTARCTLPLKDPEPPRKSSNLSPEPIPKGRWAETLMTRIAERVR
jgi:hypothetical protein